MKIKPDIAIRGFQHIGIPVLDIARSEAFYAGLGFKNIMKAGFTSGKEKGIAVMMENTGAIIELYQMPQSQLDEIRIRRNGHIDHIAFDVPDIDLAFAELKNAGFNIEDESPVFLDFWKNGCRYFTIIGPDGERLEFNHIL
jgi:catechol 2,3-dioxygenase-like lactoylglutathione lyase family enzyme